MPSLPRLVNVSQRFSIQIRTLCSLKDNTESKTCKKDWFLKCIIALLLLISLHVFYTSYYSCEKEDTSMLKSTRNYTFPRYYHYHQRILNYNRFMAMNYRLVNLGAKELPHYNEQTPICRLNYSNLGPVRVNKTRLRLRWVYENVKNIRIGGYHAPKHCRSRHKVAILIPFRDRAINLAILLLHLHPILQKQFLEYRIFVIEQYGTGKFNKGALFNAGYLESQRFGRWHCLVFHDVDLVPQDERILYSCSRNPTHMSAAVESLGYKIKYPQLFGGVTSMTPQQYKKVNGYSNYYRDWGAEDDDMFIRVQSSRLAMLRYNTSIARYATIPHKRNNINPERYHILAWAKRRFRYEGLNTLEYKLIEIVKKRLFTHVIVDVDPYHYDVQ